MKFRFVYVNRAGAEVEIDSVESLRSAVLERDLHDETLLYDGLTRDWAPARVHPIYRLIRDSIADDPGTGGEPASIDLSFDDLTLTEAGDEVPPTEAASDPLGDVALVTPIEVEPDPEVDHEAAFWAEQERAREEEAMEGRVMPAFSRAEARPEPAEPAPRPGEPRPALPQEPAPRPERILPLDVPDWSERARTQVQDALTVEVPRRQAALMIVLAGVGGWGIADSWTPPVYAAEGPEVVPVAASWRVSTYFTRGHADVRSGAFRDMVVGMDRVRARMGVGTAPEGWLGDGYLEAPSDFPEVAVYWGRYQAMIEELRDQEESLFRSGYVSRMQRKGITGTVLSIQVARALVEFRQDRPRREMLYRGMEELATAALALHEGLLEDEGAGDFGRTLELQRVLRALASVTEGDPAQVGDLGQRATASLSQLRIPEVEGTPAGVP